MMKIFMKTLLTSSLLTVAGSASAATISVSIHNDAVAAETAFLASLSGPKLMEDFNSLGSAPDLSGANHQNRWENKSSSFDTAIGIFTLVQAGQAGGDNVHNDELMIESDRTGEFGRNLGLDRGQDDLWLDSNDAKNVSWYFGAPLANSTFNAFGFYLSDAADVSAKLTLTFTDGNSASFGSGFVKGESNGNLKYVVVNSTEAIAGGTFTLSNSTANDGWGIDNVTIGTVAAILPEPGSVMLMGLGLLGLGAARRRAAK